MKKVILSIAILVAAITLIGVQQVNAVSEQPAMSMVMQDDGFVEVQLDSLSPEVQASVNALASEYDIQKVKFNAAEQITKVKLVKKEDQSEKVVYFDAQGNKVQYQTKNEEAESQMQRMQQKAPSAETFAAMQQEDGFVNVKFEELNEKVQAAVRALINEYDINMLEYDAEKKITKVTATSKEDESQKIFYFDDEGKEVTLDAAPQETTTEAPMLL